MTSYTPTANDFRDTTETAHTATKPPVKGGPVLMADCTTPIAGETLLSLLWRRWDQKD